MQFPSEINFFTENIDFDLNKKEHVINIILSYMENAGHECGVINYIFCSDDYLLQLNKQYLNHDYYTDILSFQLNDEPIEGDIFISIDRVRENATTLNIDFEEELMRVIAHGILHFMGYKDKTPEQKEQMRNKENELIDLLKNVTDGS